MFRITREMYHGTVNYEGQIGRNLLRKKAIKQEIETLNQTCSSEIKCFITEHLSCSSNERDRLLNPKKTGINNLIPTQRKLFLNHPIEKEIYISTRALINNKIYHTFSYAQISNQLNCYTIQITDEKKKNSMEILVI